MKSIIVDKKPDYLVINKPAGLLAHGAEHIKDQDNLADALVKDFPGLSGVGEDPARPGLVHRLDKPVSGLLVVARNQAMFEALKAQFQERKTIKRYQGLVHGRIDTQEAVTIDFPIERSRSGHKMAALPKTVKGEANPGGRAALTEFTVKQRFINYSLLDIAIKTGRTHQIRAHLAAYGHPLLGDDLYGTKKARAKNQKAGIKRIFLHAYFLEFRDLGGQACQYEIGLPGELKELLETKIK